MVATKYDWLLNVLGQMSDDFISNAHCGDVLDAIQDQSPAVQCGPG
jgi:hypothetical protein